MIWTWAVILTAQAAGLIAQIRSIVSLRRSRQETAEARARIEQTLAKLREGTPR